MKEGYILAIDQGTTGTTVLLIDHEGQVAGRAYSEITQHYPRPGWVEHDPEEIWTKTLSTAEAAVQSAGIECGQIAAIGITNQRETSVVWDRRSGKPVHNAIVWQCRRTSEMCEQLRERGLAEKIQQKTGLVIDPYFSATKLAWFLDNVEGLRDAAERGYALFGNVDTWLLWKLTDGKVHATDYTNASRTMLFNIHSLEWDAELLAELRIPRAMLPEVYPSSGSFDVVNCGSNLLDGIPIAGDAGDQQAALFGQACFQPGSVKNTYGTGCFLMLNTGENAIASKHGLLTTIACGTSSRGMGDFPTNSSRGMGDFLTNSSRGMGDFPHGGSPIYALEGSVFITGAAVQWLRDGLKIIESAAETESLANSVPDTGGVYVVPAFTGLGAPYWDADARGAILGITRGTGREHIVRATLESIAYQTADVMSAMRSDSAEEIQQLRVDGGAAANNFLMQFQSDVLGMEVNRPIMSETTALGAAFLAGLAVGFWRDESQLEECRRTDAIFSPRLSTEERTRLMSDWQKAVSKVMYKGTL